MMGGFGLGMGGFGLLGGLFNLLIIGAVVYFAVSLAIKAKKD
mgnify:CR=1 FL=1